MSKNNVIFLNKLKPLNPTKGTVQLEIKEPSMRVVLKDLIVWMSIMVLWGLLGVLLASTVLLMFI